MFKLMWNIFIFKLSIGLKYCIYVKKKIAENVINLTSLLYTSNLTYEYRPYQSNERNKIYLMYTYNITLAQLYIGHHQYYNNDSIEKSLRN